MNEATFNRRLPEMNTNKGKSYENGNKKQEIYLNLNKFCKITEENKIYYHKNL